MITALEYKNALWYLLEKTQTTGSIVVATPVSTPSVPRSGVLGGMDLAYGVWPD